MNEWSFFCANGGNQSWQVWMSLRGKTLDGGIKHGCHNQVKWEWMSLSQIELVWVRVRVEWECFWVNLREDKMVSESKMAVSESKMAEFKMAAIIKLSQNEWVKFFLCKMAESKMAAIISWVRMNEFEPDWISLSQSFVQNGWIHDGRIQDGCHHQVDEIELVWTRLN